MKITRLSIACLLTACTLLFVPALTAQDSGAIEEMKHKLEVLAKQRAELKEKLAATRKRGADEVSAKDLSSVGEEIRKAVAEGKISKEEARKKMAAMRKMAGQDRKAAAVKKDKKAREDGTGALAKIRKAVAEGKITEEQARAKIAEIEKKMRPTSERDAKGDSRKFDRTKWGMIKERIEGAVKAGKMTREEADAAYKKIEERMKAGGDK